VKISDALFNARNNLASKGVSNSKLDSLILLTHTFFVLGEKISKEQIIFNPNRELNDQQQKLFESLVDRRSAREPVSHIIGKREFFGADFLVSANVLDPRPDSETLIELVLKKFSNINQQIKILEIGVGSGCLTISLLKNLPNSEALGVDISEAALKTCQENIFLHQVENRFEVIKSNLFAALAQNSNSVESTISKARSNLKFDLIISNPPYIPSSEIEKLQDEVKIYEPKIALDGGADGLDFYRKIAAHAKEFLQINGKIILEIGFGQAAKIIQIFTENNFALDDLKQDLSGVERVLCFVAIQPNPNSNEI